MCLIALLYRVADDAPVLVGANREEFYDRPGEPPRLHADSMPWAGGFDPVGGGTWLGVNARGLLVAVTNRHKEQVPAPRRSRGLLVRDLLRHADAGTAIDDAATRLEAEPYDGCNVLVADAGRAAVLHAGDRLDVRALSPGVHVLANSDVNDPDDRRVRHVLGWLGARRHPTVADGLAALREVCAQTEPEHPPITLRLTTRGTVSSSLLALPADLAAGVYLHSQGPPDRTPYFDRSDLLRQLVRI